MTEQLPHMLWIAGEPGLLMVCYLVSWWGKCSSGIKSMLTEDEECSVHSRLMVACPMQPAVHWPFVSLVKTLHTGVLCCMLCFGLHCVNFFQLKQKIGASYFVVCQQMLHTISWLTELLMAPNVVSIPQIFVSWDSVGFVVWLSIWLNWPAISSSLTILKIRVVVRYVLSVQPNRATDFSDHQYLGLIFVAKIKMGRNGNQSGGMEEWEEMGEGRNGWGQQIRMELGHGEGFKAGHASNKFNWKLINLLGRQAGHYYCRWSCLNWSHSMLQMSLCTLLSCANEFLILLLSVPLIIVQWLCRELYRATDFRGHQ